MAVETSPRYEFLVAKKYIRWSIGLLIATFVIYVNIHAMKSAAYSRAIHDNNVVERINAPNEDSTERQPCTVDHFRDYYSNHQKFPYAGRWVTRNKTTDFDPELCKLQGQPLDSDFTGKCLTQSKLSSILVMGDSNSGRYFRSLMSLLSNVPDNAKYSDDAPCRFVRSEVHEPRYIGKDFYKTGDAIIDESLQTHSRFCGKCGGSEVNCTYTDRNLRLLRVPMTSLIDTSISIVVPVAMKGKEHEYWAPTTQEYLFRYYLKDSYPDVVIFFIPFSHIKNGVNTVERARADMEYFHFFAKSYLPHRTKVFYITGPAEHDFAKPDAWKGRRYQGMLANEKLDELNKMMYGVIEKDLLDDNSNIYGFFDLMKLGETRGNWTKGGVHMNYYWYDAITTYIVEIICNSVLADALTFN